jgi:pSer/pThr/pTyr-binding forkhead associated (FHA) protein
LQHISRKHFKITRVNGEFFLEDEGSLNGTKLNGEEIKALGRRKLEDDEEILVAKVLKIRYVQWQTIQ